MSFPNSIRLAIILSLLTTRAMAQITSLSSIITEYYCPVVGKSTLLPGCGSYADAYYSSCAPLFSASKTAEYQSCARDDPVIGALECSCYNELLTCAGQEANTASALGNGFCGATGSGVVIATTSSTSTSEGSASSSASPSSIVSSTVTSTGAVPESSDSASSSSAATTSGPEAGTTATQTQASSTSSSQSSNAAAGKQPMLNVLCLSVGLVIAALA